MPCDSIQLNRIDLPKMAPELTEAAMRAAGITDARRVGSGWTFSFEGNTFTLRGGELQSYDASDAEMTRARNAIARGYSEQIIQVAAKKNNWNVRKVGARAYVAVKR